MTHTQVHVLRGTEFHGFKLENKHRGHERGKAMYVRQINDEKSGARLSERAATPSSIAQDRPAHSPVLWET